MSLISTIYTNIVARFMSRDDEQGQTLVEYALIIALVSVFLVGALTLLAGGIENAFDAVISALNAAISGGAS